MNEKDFGLLVGALQNMGLKVVSANRTTGVLVVHVPHLRSQ